MKYGVLSSCLFADVASALHSRLENHRLGSPFYHQSPCDTFRLRCGERDKDNVCFFDMHSPCFAGFRFGDVAWVATPAITEDCK